MGERSICAESTQEKSWEGLLMVFGDHKNTGFEFYLLVLNLNKFIRP